MVELNLRHAAPAWFRAADRLTRRAIEWLACSLLALTVAFTAYTVVMRYLFSAPPFWGDTISLFCNIWLVFIAYALAVRDREDISSEAIYLLLPKPATAVLRCAWTILTLGFALYLAWFGLQAALAVPGRFWELGGLPKTVPMLALPLCGVLVVWMSLCNIAEDLLGWRRAAEVREPNASSAGQPESERTGR